MSSQSLRELPVIDLSLADDPATAPGLHADLLWASREVGFFYLVGHGIDRARMDEIFDVARRLFALPEADKRSVEMTRSPAFRGYTRLGGERTNGQVDWREQIDLGTPREPVPATPDAPWNVFEGPNQWPAATAEDLPVVERWMADLAGVGDRLLRAWSVALGQAPDVFAGIYGEQPSALFKLVRYPAVDDPDRSQGVGGHKDAGGITLLLLEEGSAGLQVEHDGRWIDAPPLPGAFVVNIGEVLEVATQGLLKATRHRVVLGQGGRERISVPYFYNPSYNARVPVLTLPPELAAHARGVTQDDANVLHETHGANFLKSRLRAHPDVAAIHHPELVARYGG